MNKQKCTDMHEYGPFIKSKSNYYRICNICKKKQTYPITDEINNEYENQILTKYIIDIIIQEKINLIPTNEYFFKLISCLCDHTSYIYANSIKKKKLIIKLQTLNIYYNTGIKERYDIVDNYINYLIKINKNTKNTTEKELNKQDEMYYQLQNNFNQELELIHNNEENNTIEIEDNTKNIKNNNMELQEIEENA